MGADPRDEASDRSIRAVAEPVIRQVNSALRETVNLGVPKGQRVYRVCIIAGSKDSGGIAQVGDGDYFHCTALGKAILAFQSPELGAAHPHDELLRLTDHTILDKRRLFVKLSEVHRRAYAADRDENEAGNGCFGVPVRDRRGLLVAASSASLCSDWVTHIREFEGSESVMAAARWIETKLARRRDGVRDRSGGASQRSRPRWHGRQSSSTSHVGGSIVATDEVD